MQLEPNQEAPEMEELLYQLLWSQLQSLGLFREKRAILADLREQVGISTDYDRWLQTSIVLLGRKRYLYCQDGICSVLDQELTESSALWQCWDQHKERWMQNANLKARVVLVETMLRALPAILTGKLSATKTMFPKASMRLVEGIYQRNVIADYFNDVLAQLVVTYLQERLAYEEHARIRILEIGAGTGGTTSRVLQMMQPHQTSIAEYCYSDISAAFLRYGEQAYGKEYPYLTYRIFNVEKPLAEQGIELGGYDLVIAANVLHATSNIQRTVRNAKAALKKHGLLLLNEITGINLFSHLTFGLLEGWWAYEDPELRVPGCPALTAENWQVVLSSEGFGAIYHPTHAANLLTGVNTSPLPYAPTTLWEASQQVIVAESDGVVRQQLPAEQNLRLLSETKVAKVPVGAAPVESVTDPNHEGGQEPCTISTDKLREALKQVVSSLLRVQVKEIDTNTLLSEYGFDSITFMEFANHLNQTYQLNLTPPLFYEHSTIERLAQYLQETYPAALAPYFVEASSHVGIQKDSTSVAPRLALDETDKVPPIGESPMVTRWHSRSGSSLMPTSEQQAQAGREAIAIIGMSGAFPQAPDVQSLWRNLLVGRDCISEIPASRWDWRAYFGDPATPNLNKTNIKWAGVIEDVELFDPLFFGISPSEAEQMDPQQRLLMMYVWKAIEDAGYSAESLSGTNTALFVGTASSGYSERIFRANMAIEGHTSTGLAASVGPNRMSYFLNLHGPSEPIETACSSSLVAIHRGVNAIESGQCNMVIAGGVNTLISPEGHISLSKAGMLSLDGRCKTFSAQANGFVRSEGVGMLVLKKLSDAEQAGDHIYAVIRATAENHGGRANSLTAPNPRAQADLLIAAYRKAAIDPRTVGYIEVHGTGTELGDPIEINGLKAAFSELMHTGVSEQEQATTYTSPSGSDEPIPIATCGIGTVKSNIGHLELAAGVAGVIKVLLQMQHKTLVKSLHCEQINPYIGLEGSPFYIVQENREWEALRDSAGNILPRRAGVSSFGFGGVNAHVVLEEYIPNEQERASIVINSQNPVPIVLSAKNQERLKKRVEDLLVAIREYGFSDHDLADIAYTLQVGRDEMEQRLALLVGSMREIEEKLQSFLEGQHNVICLYQGQVKHNKEIIDIFGTDEGLQGAVEEWIEQQKYAKLLNLWVKGLRLDWNTLYRDTKPRRVSLPTYPFAKERYWCDHRVIREESGFCRLPAEEVCTPNPSPSSGNALGTLMLQPSWREETILYEEASPPHYEKHVVILCELGEDSKASIISQMRGVDCLILQSDQQEIDKKFLTYVIQVFEGIKNLIANNLRKMALIQIVVPYHEEQQLLSGLSGLLASAQREYPRLVGQLIELAAYTQDLAEILLENSRCPSSQKIRYRDGKRWVADWQEVEETRTGGECPWKDGGIYLITGGAGGLGLIFAQEIANQVKDATLILTGRSPLDAEKQERIKQLGVQGTQVTYEQVDVTQRQAVFDLIQRIQQDYGNLDGIIHSAGVIRDNFLLKKTRDEIVHVLAPKVTGLVNLDQASKDIPLDFFLLFSALAGAFGSVGQTDYAAANVFMDEYARYRNYLVASQQRWGKTLSINWPLWKEGGMRVDTETAKVLSENAGMVPMETPAGVRALYQGFALAEDQVLILEGNLSKLKAYGSDRTGKAPSYPATEAYLQIDPVRLREKVIQQIKVQFSAITKLSAAHIDAHEPLENYGIDSLKIVQLNQRFAAIFGELSKTLFFEYRTLDELATYFMEDYQQACIEWTGLKEEAISSMSRPSVSKQHTERVFPTPISLRRGEKQAHSISIADSGKPEREPIAIIGIAGRYPGARNLKDYWKNLKAGQSSITEIPAERWPLEGFYHADINEAVKQGKSYSKWGGFVEGFADFDPLFFRISPQEAQSIDPQERLFIETCWAALEDAGYTREQLGVQCHHKVGVFAGITKTGFSLYGPDLWKRGKDRDDLHLLHPSTSFGSVANRVSYLLNLQGPSMPIDTMCSSSLTALHEACEHIYRGECKMALAGGVNLYLHPANYIFLCAQNMLSVDGLCKSFGQGGNGFVPGEGVGVVVLKRLSEAIADHDQIYAVIRATGINHGGTTNGYTVPNPTAQGELIHSTLSKAGISARTVSYIEGHGTGTELGDPIEVTGLTQAFHRDTQEIGFCALGSVKSNIGHLEAAAGIAGVTKIVLQMKYQKIVPSLHAKTINPNINSTKIPFVLQQELTDWKRPLVELNGEGRLYPRIAGISSFGAGGANAHLVLEEYIPDTHPRTAITVDAHNPAIIVLSARNEEQLKKRAQQLLEEIVDQQLSDENLADLAYTLQVGREAMQERLAVVAGSMKKLAEKLEQFVEDQDGIVDVYRGQVKRYKEALAVLDVDDDIGIAIDAWVSKKKYGKLLDLWVKGLAFDWNKLYGDVKPYRISLPTYPFARERYWLPTFATEVVRSSCSLTNTCGENQSDEPRIQAVAALHPLVQSNTSSESGTIPAIPAISQPLLSQNPLQPSRQRSRSDATKPDEILAFTISYLVNILSTVLKISPEKLDREVGFDEYGLDSIIIARLHPMIEVVFGPIPSTTFFQYKCITDLAHYFLKEHKETLNALFQQRSKSQSLQWEEMRQDQPQKGSSSETECQKPVTVQASEVHTGEQDIALIGISGHYPQAANLDAFWSNLESGRDCIVEIPRERWDYQKYYKAGTGGKTGGMYCKWGGFLPEIDTFDPSFFHISPLEARFMDPQERLFLQIVAACFEDAGYSKRLLRDESAGDGRANVGVFAGVTYNNYQLYLIKEYEQGNIVPVNSQTYSIANRVSYIYNLSGPSVALDTACSSSLYAIHLACESIKRGECAMAIAGGVNLSLHPSKYITLCATQFASSDGHCRSFGQDGDGYVPGEGVGAVLLKPLRDAIADGDHIYAVIKGSAVNNDGKTFGYSVPNPVAQTEVIHKALTVAHVHPRSISYVEAHGTGTKLGDPIEITGLSDAFNASNASNEYTSDKQFCAIGSVKSNIGHLEAAAGISQVAKVVLQMKHKKLVPSLLHTSKLNPHIDFENTPFFVQQTLEEWKQPVIQVNGEEVVYPRRAGISSFGAGGVNVHLVLEEYQAENDTDIQGELNKEPVIIVLSAQKEQNLRVSAQLLKDFMEKSMKDQGKMAKLKDVAYTLQTGRDPMPCRLAFTARDVEEIIEKLKLFLNQEEAFGKNGLYIQYNIKSRTAEKKLKIEQAPDNLETVRSSSAIVEKIAELWASGREIDWESMCQNERRFKIPLPTYPFSKERYWVGEAPFAPTTEAVGTGRPQGIAPTAPIQKQEDEKPGQPESVTFLAELCQALEGERLEMIERYVQDVLASLLAFNPPDVPGLHQGFFDMGMESVLAEQFRVSLEGIFLIDLTDTAIFDYPNISELSAYIVKHIPFSELEKQNLPHSSKLEEMLLLEEMELLAMEDTKEVQDMTLEEVVYELRKNLAELMTTQQKEPGLVQGDLILC